VTSRNTGGSCNSSHPIFNFTVKLDDITSIQLQGSMSHKKHEDSCRLLRIGHPDTLKFEGLFICNNHMVLQVGKSFHEIRVK
jgi:hypothetical protein